MQIAFSEGFAGPFFNAAPQSGCSAHRVAAATRSATPAARQEGHTRGKPMQLRRINGTLVRTVNSSCAAILALALKKNEKNREKKQTASDRM
jgi:hypothetical protein